MQREVCIPHRHSGSPAPWKMSCLKVKNMLLWLSRRITNSITAAAASRASPVILLTECAQVSVFFPVTCRLGYLWAAVSQAAPTIRDEQVRGHLSLFSPEPMMSGPSVPSLKLAACHPSCWSGSLRDPIGREHQLDLDQAAVSVVLICIRPEEGYNITYTLLLMLLLPWCGSS